MEDLVGEIVTAIVVALAAAAWRKLELGWLRAMLRAAIVGVEKGTAGLPAHEAEKVKQAVKEEATRTGAQARLHDLVKQITEEPK